MDRKNRKLKKTSLMRIFDDKPELNSAQNRNNNPRNIAPSNQTIRRRQPQQSSLYNLPAPSTAVPG